MVLWLEVWLMWLSYGLCTQHQPSIACLLHERQILPYAILELSECPGFSARETQIPNILLRRKLKQRTVLCYAISKSFICMQSWG